MFGRGGFGFHGSASCVSSAVLSSKDPHPVAIATPVESTEARHRGKTRGQ